MSLWGATVITNLLSAIPVFGQDIVELNIIIGNLNNFFLNLNSFLTVIYNNLYLKSENLKVEEIINISAILPLLPTIGTVSRQACFAKKGKKIISDLDKKEYLSVPYQFIAFLVGFIDGDGYIQITKTPKGYITIKLVIGIHLEDLSTLEYIQSVLKLGRIEINKDHRSPNCKLIFNRTELQEVIFPLFLYHNIFFLTNTRRNQFDLAMFILKNEKKVYEDIPNIEKILTLFQLPETGLDYLNLPFFKNWLVGFTLAEGSFLIKTNNDACFQLKQRIHIQLFEAFKLLFDTNRKIIIENNKYNQFSISSKADIQKTINFFSFSGHHPLIGLKNIQYFNWLAKLKFSSRYKNLKFPE